MAGVKLFRKADQDLTPNERGGAVRGLINPTISEAMGGGIGTFENCANEWTVTYDEILFIHQGEMTLRVGDDDYRAGPGDVLWIPKDTTLVYIAEAKVTFFYAVFPATGSPSARHEIVYPTAGPS